MTATTTREGAAAGPISRTVRLVIVALCCFGFAGQLARALVVTDDSQLRLWYLGLGGSLIVLGVLTLLLTPRPRWAVHLLLAVQCLIILALVLLARGTEVDFMTSLCVPLAAEVAVVFTGRTVWVWIGVLAALTTLPLLAIQGLLEGLALAPVSLAPEVVIAAFVVVARDLEAARRRSQAILDDLRTAHAQLEAYSARAGELAAVAERDRVARDLNESVAARIGGVLAAAEAARRALGAAPAGGPAAPVGGGTAGKRPPTSRLRSWPRSRPTRSGRWPTCAA